MHFHATKEILPNGLTAITLGSHQQEVKILPEMGFNLYSWTIGGVQVMMEPADLTQTGCVYGTPVLFPTPNRVPGGLYEVAGKKYLQRKNGKAVWIHGLVMDESFVYEQWDNEKGAYAVGKCEIKEGDAMYEGFPFPCELQMIYRLDENGVALHVKVTNLGQKILPFGYAIHPYFSIMGGRENITIKSEHTHVFDAYECQPSGILHPTAGTQLDLRLPKTVEELNLDHVFHGYDQTKSAEVYYKEQDIRIVFSATDDFKNMVIYTPKSRDCFCIENQTCSTNAHNLYAWGYEKESGLILLAPEGLWEGTIKMSVV